MSKSKQPKTPARVISRADLAAKWGVSPNTIDTMRQEGLLRTVQHGWFDADEADRVRAAQDPVAREKAMVAKMAAGQRPPASTSGEPGDGDDAASLLYRARAMKVHNEAAIASLKFRAAAGELVNREEVAHAGRDAGRALLAALLAVPARCGSQLAVESDPDMCVEILQRELDAVAADLVKALEKL